MPAVESKITDEPVILVQDLVKSYGTHRAVNGLSLTVSRGELLALLGPNGAGKTTTVEILEGYRRADSGLARVLGLDPTRDAQRLRPRVGLMLQQGGVYPSATPREALELFASFYEEALCPEQLLQLVGLEDAARTRFRRLSGGQRQRLLLALALIGRPEVLFLDEPTSAMDPHARQATWAIIREQQRAGVTILLTTHSMEEAERLADRVAIIDGGRLVALGSPAALMATPAVGREVRFSTRPGLDTASMAGCLDASWVREEAPGRYVAEVTPTPARLARLAVWLQEQDALLSEYHGGHRSLEEVFLSLTGRELRD